MHLQDVSVVHGNNKYLDKEIINALIFTCAQYAAQGFVCAYVYMCVCVVKKHGCLRFTDRKAPRKGSLLLGFRIYSPVKKSTKSGE